MSFFESLNFTSSNEDGDSERRALRLGPKDRVLCLTASGTRVLDLLADDVGEVVALDINPAQNHLLRLKAAAIKGLERGDLGRFLGLSRGDRGPLWATTREGLGPVEGEFWSQRQNVTRDGVWYAGRWEKVLRFGAFGTGLLRGRNMDRLFSASSLTEQAEIWARHFDDAIWHGAIRLLGARWFWTHVIGEPGGAYLPDGQACVERLAGAFRRAAGQVLFSESDFAWLVLRGRHDAGALPVHLRPEHLDAVRSRLDRLTIVDGSLADMDALGRFDAFSLSDFGSYCDQAGYDACWDGIRRVAKPGARYCERVFMNPLKPSVPVEVDEALSAELTARDKAIIYDMRAGRL